MLSTGDTLEIQRYRVKVNGCGKRLKQQPQENWSGCTSIRQNT